MSIIKGALYIVATPIGNLEDLSPRAKIVLKNVDLILAEDTRHSKPMLNKFARSDLADKGLLDFHLKSLSLRVICLQRKQPVGNGYNF